MFKVGQNVKWQTTPAHKRIGKVVFVVPAGQSPTLNGKTQFLWKGVGKELKDFVEATIFSGKCNSSLSDGGPRNHESYLVEVLHPKKGALGKSTIYWPRVKNLELATAADI